MIFVGSEQIFYVNFDVWQVFVFEIPSAQMVDHSPFTMKWMIRMAPQLFVVLDHFERKLVLFLGGDL